MDTTPERRRMKRKHGANGDAWKEKFRQGCMERLRNKRQNFVNSLRNKTLSPGSLSPSSSQEYVNQVMIEEWKQMKLESPLSLSGSSRRGFKRKNEFESDDDEDFPESIEDALDYFQEIQVELLKEEERMLSQYEELMSFDDQYIHDTIAMLSTAVVVCPVCQKNNLLQNKHIIFCACGVRIDTQTDAINLEHVQKLLDQTVTEHSSNCQQNPAFHVADLSGVGLENLVLSCQPTCVDLSFISGNAILVRYLSTININMESTTEEVQSPQTTTTTETQIPQHSTKRKKSWYSISRKLSFDHTPFITTKNTISPEYNNTAVTTPTSESLGVVKASQSFHSYQDELSLKQLLDQHNNNSSNNQMPFLKSVRKKVKKAFNGKSSGSGDGKLRKAASCSNLNQALFLETADESKSNFNVVDGGCDVKNLTSGTLDICRHHRELSNGISIPGNVVTSDYPHNNDKNNEKSANPSTSTICDNNINSQLGVARSVKENCAVLPGGRARKVSWAGFQPSINEDHILHTCVILPHNPGVPGEAEPTITRTHRKTSRVEHVELFAASTISETPSQCSADSTMPPVWFLPGKERTISNVQANDCESEQQKPVNEYNKNSRDQKVVSLLNNGEKLIVRDIIKIDNNITTNNDQATSWKMIRYNFYDEKDNTNNSTTDSRVKEIKKNSKNDSTVSLSRSANDNLSNTSTAQTKEEKKTRQSPTMDNDVITQNGSKEAMMKSLSEAADNDQNKKAVYNKGTTNIRLIETRLDTKTDDNNQQNCGENKNIRSINSSVATEGEGERKTFLFDKEEIELPTVINYINDQSAGSLTVKQSETIWNNNLIMKSTHNDPNNNYYSNDDEDDDLNNDFKKRMSFSSSTTTADTTMNFLNNKKPKYISVQSTQNSYHNYVDADIKRPLGKQLSAASNRRTCLDKTPLYFDINNNNYTTEQKSSSGQFVNSETFEQGLVQGNTVPPIMLGKNIVKKPYAVDDLYIASRPGKSVSVTATVRNNLFESNYLNRKNRNNNKTNVTIPTSEGSISKPAEVVTQPQQQQHLETENITARKTPLHVSVEDIKCLVEGILKRKLADKMFEEARVTTWCKDIVNTVRDQIKLITEESFSSRRKVIASAYIGPKTKENSVHVAIKCQKQMNTDDFITVAYESDSLFVWVSLMMAKY